MKITTLLLGSTFSLLLGTGVACAGEYEETIELFKHAGEIESLHLIVHPFLLRVLTISGLTDIARVEPAPAPEDGRG